ncbi:type VII secretion target [Gordonia sp. NPDC003429]
MTVPAGPAPAHPGPTDPAPTDPTLTATTEFMDGFATAHRAAAARVGAHAASTRVGLESLTPTFGMIGAEFLSALGTALEIRSRRLEQVAAAHRAVAEATRAADTAYATTDRSAEMGLRL